MKIIVQIIIVSITRVLIAERMIARVTEVVIKK